MNQRRIAIFPIVVLAAALQITAQLRSPLLEPSDPFKIKPGSTFSASGGAGGPRSNPSTTRRITDDLREAQAIVLGNHIGANNLDPASTAKSALTQMLHTLDPHSNFHDNNEWKDLLAEQKSGYTGIGATIADYNDGQSNDTYVLAVFPHSPAAVARLQFGDRIIAVNGENTRGLGSSVVRDKIRGEAGTTLRLTIERVSTLRAETIDLKRNSVSQPAISDAYLLKPGVGYVDLTSGFNYTTADEFDRAIRDLKRQGVRSLILDLRDNGGGILEQAVRVAEKFLPAGTKIVTQRGRSPLDNRNWVSRNAAPETMPLVVLVNQNTASASEILAGAFQDDDRAIIMGEKTYGKGLVQTVIDLPGGAGLTLTTARYLTPSGRSIQRDYSSVDLYDYYNKKTPGSAIGRSFFEARTVTNRRVYGGDGIQPDEPLKAEKITAKQAALLDPIFTFARNVINGRVPGNHNRGVGQPSTKGVNASDPVVSDSLMSSFDEFLLSHPRYRFTRKALEGERDYIRLRLSYYLVMATHGAAPADQVLINADPQIVKAVDALPRAAQLIQKAARARLGKK